MTDYKGPNAFSRGGFKPAKPPKSVGVYARSPDGVARQTNGPAFNNKFPKSRYPRGGGQSDGGDILLNVTAPLITGTPTVGEILSCSTGTWTGSPSSYAYQWERDGVAIGGATSSTYLLVSDDGETSVSCLVTASNGAASASQISNALDVSAPAYAAKAVHFAGTPIPTYLQSNNLTGSDSPLGLFSFWMNLLGASGETGLYQTVNGRFWFITVKNNSGTLHIAAEFWDTTNNFAFTFSIDVAFPAEPWLSIQITVDTNHSAGQKIGQIVVNRTYYPVTVTRDAAGPYSIGWSQDADNTVFGNQPDNTDGNDFDISECYGAMGQFLDISVANNVAKFVDGDNKPVSLGSDGATPTGVAPTIYFSGDASTFGTNLGAGGVFTLAGPLTNASTSPSD